jgi:hypothetical protein
MQHSEAQSALQEQLRECCGVVSRALGAGTVSELSSVLHSLYARRLQIQAAALLRQKRSRAPDVAMLPTMAQGAPGSAGHTHGESACSSSAGDAASELQQAKEACRLRRQLEEVTAPMHPSRFACMHAETRSLCITCSV